MKTALTLSHDLLAEIISPGDFVIDATMGNGHDTLFLAQLVGPLGKVLAYDVQQLAFDQTQHRLLTAGAAEQVQLFLRGHETLKEDLPIEQELAGAIFNLGYLPKGDKSIITKSDTTISALTALLPVLKKGGRILLVLYYGHPGGTIEKDALIEFCQQLPQKDFQVALYQFLNQKNSPPMLLAIERNKK